MGLGTNESTASMWNQAFQVLKVNWCAYTQDQERGKPLVSTRFYQNKWAKNLPPSMMEMFIQEVRPILILKLAYKCFPECS